MKKIALLTLTILPLLFINCSKSSSDPEPGPNPSVTLDNAINDFVWKGLNSWYNWQADVPNLADSKDDVKDDYYTYLNGYANPTDLFDALLYDYGNTDRFSWFVDDYVVQNQQFQGISKSLGLRLQGVQIDDTGSNSDRIIFYVRYVAPNSPASDAGIKRGDIINALNGTVMNVGNYY
ncbi:MAG: PDZ domain-containing protein, partial [Flavobacteriaceae bacterium]|nr:PDZ domain-containing protein [Flavobacteriaceae bacterium]